MMRQYATEYSNQVHQLAVSVSRHYFATKDGRLKYQNKPIDVHLHNVSASERNHVVHYVLRDHFSGLFYSEIAFVGGLAPLEGFLHRAWSEKEDYLFCGLPDLLMVPRTVDGALPTIKERVLKLGVQLVEVTSGFQSGIRDIRTIEEDLKFVAGESIETAVRYARQICRFQAERKSRNGREKKLELWAKYLAEIRIPPNGWISEAGLPA